MIIVTIKMSKKTMYMLSGKIKPSLHGGNCSGSRSGSQSETQSGSRSRCTCLHGTFIVQYNEAPISPSDSASH